MSARNYNRKHKRDSDSTTDFTTDNSTDFTDFTDHTDFTDFTDHTDSTDSNSFESRRRNLCDDRCKDSSDCSVDCGLRFSDTPVGIWNLIFNYDDTMVQDRPSQLVLNADGTFNNFASPDLNNNPFPVLLTPGVGIWKKIKERHLKLQGTHIGYKKENGNPEVYYTIHINMKISKKGTRVRFCGKAVPRSINDPRLCTRSDLDTVCFTGCGFKLLTPPKDKFRCD